MLNKEMLSLQSGSGFIKDQRQLAAFLERPPGGPATFSPGILHCEHWRQLTDHLIYYQTQNSWARAQTANVRLDWIEADQAPHFAWSQAKLVAGVEPQNQPTFSFIVPFRDRKQTLALTLQGLRQQSSQMEFEVIVVDDGSVDEPTAEFFKELEDLPGPWRVYRLPPCAFFRAGFARNVGALKAKGEFLVFLDSDIIVSPGFLETVRKELVAHDLVQACRWQIWQDEWRDVTDLGKLNLPTRLRDEPNPFWRDFHLTKVNWMDLPQPWRFVSSNCLAIKRQSFLQLGGFRHWYSDYGFEDTDLGYRAWLQGLRLGRSENSIFHLTSAAREEWVIHLIGTRNDLLKPSARRFFLINRPLDALDWLVHLIL